MGERLDLTVELGRGLRLRSPVLVASGTFGYGFDAPQVDRSALGAIVTKGTTLRPREGNVPNRIAETPSGMLNAMDCRILVSIRWRAPTPPFGPPGTFP